MNPSTPTVFGAPLPGDVMVEVRFIVGHSDKVYYYFTHVGGRGSWRPKPGAIALVDTGGSSLKQVEIVAVYTRDDPVYSSGGQNLQKQHPEFSAPHKRLHSACTAPSPQASPSSFQATCRLVKLSTASKRNIEFFRPRQAA
jgi:hypothetical protein